MSIALAKSHEDSERWEKTRLRRRLLEGCWKQDIVYYMSLHLDKTRQGAWGEPSQSMNLYKSIVQQLAVIYNETPQVSNADMDELQEEYLKEMNLFSKAQQHSEYVIGLRDSIYRIYWNPRLNKVELRLVTPDYVLVETDPYSPQTPIKISEAVEREYQGEEIYTWEVWDISNPESPSLKIFSEDMKDNLTGYFLGEAPYLFINPVTKQPFLPYVIYHAQDTGECFDDDSWSELVHGTLEVALLWSFWIHIVKDASWAQKYGIDVDLQGLSTKPGQERASISTDPASILMFKSKDGQSGSLNSMQVSLDPKSVADSILQYSSAIMENLGLLGADLQKSSTQSGVSIQIRKDAIRLWQKRFEPMFRLGDKEMLEKVSLISNLFAPEGFPILPITGYDIKYTAIEKTQAEIQELISYNESMLRMGLKSKVDMLMELEGITREQAVMKLEQIKKDSVY